MEGIKYDNWHKHNVTRSAPPITGAAGVGSMNLRLDEMVCCSWHEPRNAVVELSTGRIIPKEVLDRIEEGPAKDDMRYSGGMCNPCMSRVLAGRKPKPEGLMR